MTSILPAEFNPYAAPKAPLGQSGDAIQQTLLHQYPPTSLVWRLLAAVIDVLVFASFVFVLGSLWIAALWLFDVASRPLSVRMGVAVASLIIGIPFFAYFGLMESSSTRATLGKLAAGLRVTDYHGNRLSFPRASARAVVSLVATVIFPIQISALVNRRRQTVADIFARSVVTPDTDAASLCTWWKVPLVLLLLSGSLLLASFGHAAVQGLSPTSAEIVLTPLQVYYQRIHRDINAWLSLAGYAALTAFFVALLVRLTRGARMRKPRWDADTH